MSPKTKHACIVTTQILLWTTTNFCYVFDTQTLYHKFTHAAVIIDLTLMQVLLGLFVATFINVSRTYLSDTDIPLVSKSHRGTRFTTLPLTLVHLTATLLTNLSYRAIGPGPTLVWKLSEPLFAIFLRLLILRESTNILSVVGILLLLAGLMTYSIKPLAMFALSPVLLANVLYRTRNVILKLDQKSFNHQVFPEQRIFVVNRLCLPFCLGMLLIRLWFSRPELESISFLIRTALLFNVYQFTSVFLLNRFDPVTHSVTNAVKRFTTILLSSLVFGQSLSERRILGLFLAAIGLPLYLQGEKLWKACGSRKRTAGVAFVAVFLLFWDMSSMFSQRSPESILSGAELEGGR